MYLLWRKQSGKYKLTGKVYHTVYNCIKNDNGTFYHLAVLCVLVQRRTYHETVLMIGRPMCGPNAFELPETINWMQLLGPTRIHTKYQVVLVKRYQSFPNCPGTPNNTFTQIHLYSNFILTHRFSHHITRYFYLVRIQISMICVNQLVV